MADFDKSIDLDKAFKGMVQDVVDVANKLRKEGEEAGEAFGYGWDDGFEDTIEKIKISSIKTDRAFKNLSEKIRKQVQQLSTNINGKDTKIKIDFSNVDINSESIQKEIERKVKSIKTSDLFEFDTKNFDGQLKNFVTLFMKYREKLNLLQQDYPNIATPKDAKNNLQQQLVLATELDKMFKLLNQHGALFTGINLGGLRKDLSKLQQFADVDTAKAVGEYDELSKVLKEIHDSLRIISDTFKNENNSMKAMADSGVTSFTSLSQAIIEVYNNLTQVQSLVDNISKKDFNVTNITQTCGGNSNVQAMTQQMAVARETFEHLRQLYDQASATMQLLANNGKTSMVVEYLKQLQEFDISQINKSVKGANSEIKLASVLAEMQDYIDKLIKINQLRNQYNLGEWKDTFVPTQKSVIKPVAQEQPQTVVSPVVTQPQQTTDVGNAEVQQMTNLKGAVDEVSKAVGRKNAGFIKEKEIVDASVNAEEAKLRELVDVITNEIGNVLDNIKVKFAQSFVVPELDKGNLQTSFDEIYNKFVELKDKIQTMKIDIGINAANITTAIQEALYAKEIAANYKKADFNDLYQLDLFASFGKEQYVSPFTGEVLSKSEARDQYNGLTDDMFVTKLGTFVGNMQDVIEHLVTKSGENVEPEQNNWAQVIVEAINTQGGKIVESIKLLIPKNITDTVDESNLINAFNTLTQAINDTVANNIFDNASEYFEDIMGGGGIPDPDVANALVTLGLMSSNGRRTFTMPQIGGINSGIAISDKLVYHTTGADEVGDVYDLMEKQNRAYELGAQIPRVIAVSQDDSTAFQLQTKAAGSNFRRDPEDVGVWDATDEQIDRLLHTFEVLEKTGLNIEFGGDNVLFDKDKGFSLIDLGTENSQHHWDTQETAKGMLRSFLRHMHDISPYDADSRDKKHDLIRRFEERSELSPEQRLVNANTIAAERGQNASQTSGVNAKITPIMDEGAVAKVVAENVTKTPVMVKVTPVVEDQNKIKALASDLINKMISYDNLPKDERIAQACKFFGENPILDEFRWDDDNPLNHGQYNTPEALQLLESFIRKKQDSSDLGPVIQSALESQKAVDAESQSATDAAKQFIEAANAKKEFVDANKLVAESAKESADAVKQESEAIQSIDVEASNDSFMNPGDSFIKAETEAHKTNTEAINEEIEAEKELLGIKAKEKDIYNNDGEPIIHEDVYKYKQDGANITENIKTDAAGNEIRTIIKDFEAFNKEEKKTRENIAKFQSKLDEFVKRFRSKTGGNAQFIEGFDELSRFTINENNIEDALNKMTQLQAKYNELEGNFRKGQSSLNPFTNAITKASNIDNIFGEVEYKFNTLVNKSDELVNKFTRLQELSKSIKDFVNIINTNPDSITPAMFSEFSKQVGEFNLLKTQVEGTVKRERRVEVADAKEQAKAYDEVLRLIKERNKFLATAASAEDGSIKQRNALMDAYKIEQQLHILGKQIVLTDEQRAELARIREEQARKIRDIEADKKTKDDNQKASAREQKRKKEVEDYINLVKKKNEYETKAANGGAMKSTYEAQVAKLQQEILANDKQSIMTQEEKNRLLAIEETHHLRIAEIQHKKKTGNQVFSDHNEKLQAKFDAGYLSQENFGNWRNELAKYQSYLDGTVKADSATIAKQKANLTQLYDHLNKISNASRTFFASGGEILSTWLSPDQVQNASTSLRGLYDIIVADRFDGMKTSVTSVNETLGRLTFTVDDGKGSLAQYTIAMDKASGATKLLSGNTKETLTTTQSFMKALKGDAKGLFSAFIGGMSTMYAVGRYLKEGIQYVHELDKALTELKKVTDETEETYDKFLETAGKTSTRIGSTLSNMTSATAEFAKLGYDINTAAAMAESALVYTNVGDNVDVETGSQSIISTMKAFGIEANNTMSIVDKFNEIGNNFAITTKGIGDALQVSASAMAAAGNTLDETIALTTAANTVVSLCHVAIVIWLLVDNYISQRVWFTRDLGKTDKIIM